MADGLPPTETCITEGYFPSRVVWGRLISLSFSCPCGQQMDIPVDSSATCSRCGRVYCVTQEGMSFRSRVDDEDDEPPKE